MPKVRRRIKHKISEIIAFNNAKWKMLDRNEPQELSTKDFGDKLIRSGNQFIMDCGGCNIGAYDFNRLTVLSKFMDWSR